MHTGQALLLQHGVGAPKLWQLPKQAQVTIAVMDGLQATPAALPLSCGLEETTMGLLLALRLVLQRQSGAGSWQPPSQANHLTFLRSCMTGIAQSEVSDTAKHFW